MNPQYILFAGKHPANQKENRQYFSKPRKSWNSYGAAYSSEFFKLDIDDYDHKTGEIIEAVKGRPRSEAVIAILDSLGIKYNAQHTPNGKHIFFRVPAGLEQKNKSPRWLCPLGFHCEWKFPASDDHIVIMQNGIERKFFKGSIENTDVDELPPFLYPLQMDNAKFKLEFPEGSRTQELGAYLFYLAKKGYTADQAFQIVQLMNQYIFEKPIPEKQLKAEVLNDKTYKKLLDQQKEKAVDKLSHSDIANEIIDRFNIITVNKSFYSYENGVYKPFADERITEYLTINYPQLKANYEKEVIRFISGLSRKEQPEDDGTVNVKNGILKFSDDGNVTLIPHSKEYISFRQFNAAFQPGITRPLLDQAFSVWFENNSKQIELFNQMLGYLLMNHVNYQKIFFFVGAPSTGKTTILKLITCFCGKENVSAIQLEDMGKTFGLAPIVNKTANIFSDIRKSKVIAAETFKQLADGSPLNINQKYKKPFTYSFTGKIIFGMNQSPDFSQDFNGIERRLVIFKFNHIFKKDDPAFDPAILDVISSDECMAALLNKAISGYKSLLKNKGFITTKESEAALTDFVSDNDNVVKWLHEANIEKEYLLREPIRGELAKGLYLEYQAFCISAGETPKAQKDFSRTICNKYGFETFQKRFKNNKRFQMFREK